MCMCASAHVQAPKPRPQSRIDNADQQTLAMIQVAMKQTSDRRLFERYQTVALRWQGYSSAQISQIVGRSVTTVSHYLRAYRRGGLAALNLRHSPGRPRRLTPEQEHTVEEVVTTQVPQDVGFPAEMNWTAPLVRRYIRNTFQTEFSERGTRHLLYRLGLTCTRPTYTLAKADPEKQATFRRHFEDIKKQLLDGQIDRILFEDESMIRDYQAIGRTWFRKGHQRIVPTYGKHWGDKLLGTLDYESGEILCQHAQQYDAAEFLAFLKQILAHYVGDRIVLVLDNARIHHAKLIQPFLAKHAAHLTLMFLPPYSPQLNLIEGLWGWMKRSVIYNVFFQSVDAIIAAVDGFLKEISKDPLTIIDRLCVRL